MKRSAISSNDRLFLCMSIASFRTMPCDVIAFHRIPDFRSLVS